MLEHLIVGTSVGLAAIVLVWRLVRFMRGAQSKAKGTACSACPGCAEDTEPASATSCAASPCPPEDAEETAEHRRGPPTNCSLIALLVLASSLWAPETNAADTVEAFDAGAADAELYFGFDGIGRPEHQKSLMADMLMGYGVIQRLSLFAGATLQSDEFVSQGETALQLGAIGTPLDTDHVDIDLVLAFSIGGASFDDLRVSPAAELNFDSRPDMSGWGLYLRAGIPVYGGKRGGAGASSNRIETVVDAELTFGAYYTLAQQHQFLFEYVLAFHPSPEEGQPGAELGAAALGYNVTLNDTFELINQIQLDVPQQGEPVAFGLVVGLIATFGLL